MQKLSLVMHLIILTFDRFTLWATVLLTPAIGLMLVSLRNFSLKRFLTNNFGAIAWKSVCIGVAIIHIGLALIIVNLTKIKKMQPASLNLAVLLLKPDSVKYRFDIPYLGFEIPNKFVIGYGMDYNGLGRNLRALYQLTI